MGAAPKNWKQYVCINSVEIPGPKLERDPNTNKPTAVIRDGKRIPILSDREFMEEGAISSAAMEEISSMIARDGHRDQSWLTKTHARVMEEIARDPAKREAALARLKGYPPYERLLAERKHEEKGEQHENSIVIPFPHVDSHEPGTARKIGKGHGKRGGL